MGIAFNSYCSKKTIIGALFDEKSLTLQIITHKMKEQLKTHYFNI